MFNITVLVWGRLFNFCALDIYEDPFRNISLCYDELYVLLIWDRVRNGVDHLFVPKSLQYSRFI
jgi:hypothetical protein